MTVRLFLLVIFFFIADINLTRAKSSATEIKPRIIYIYPDDKGSPFWDSHVGFTQAVADALNLELDVIYTGKKEWRRFTVAKNLQQVIEAKKQKPSLILTRFWKGAEKHMLTYLDKNNIPLISVNTSLSPELLNQVGLPREKFPYWLAHMSPDEVLAGRELAQAILAKSRAIRCKSSNCDVTVFAINGTQESLISDKRREGLNRVINIDKNSHILNLLYLNWNGEQIAKLTNKILLRHKNIDTFWFASDVFALGFFDGLQAVNKELPNDVVIGSIDWSPQGIEKVKQGEMSVSIGGHFMEGGWCLILFYDYLNGKDFINETSSIIKSKMSIIDETNVNLLGSFLSSPQWSSSHLKSYSKFLNPDRTIYNLNPKDMIMEQIINNDVEK